MKAAIIDRLDGTFRVEEVEIDAPREREVLIAVKAAGLCHSDLHLATTDFGLTLPAVLGHEIAGVVEAVGPEVREFAVGDHVVGSLVQYCGFCAPCVGGRTFQCDHPEETLRAEVEPPRLSRGQKPITQGYGLGAFAEYALVHENQLAKVPADLPFPQASLLGCGTITGAGAAINTANIRPGDTVAVIGTGGVGLNVISGAVLAGASLIVAVDVHPAKGALAMRFGATHFVNAAMEDPIEAVRAILTGGAHHVFEVVGSKPTCHQAINMVRKGGGVYLIGIHDPTSTIEVNVVMDLQVNQASIIGVNMGSTNIKRDIPMYALLYMQGRLNLDDLVSREISIYDINEAYDELKRGTIARSVITSF